MSEATRIEKIADLTTLGAGATQEKFAAELERVLENIRDPNTDPREKREITLKFTFMPAKEDRDTVMVGIRAKSSLAATKPSGDMMYLGKDGGKLVATVLHGTDKPEDPRQGVLELKKAGDK